MSTEVLTGVSILITAVVGLLAYYSKSSNEGVNSAIHGLDILSQQHGAEIERLSKSLAECLEDKNKITGVLSNLQRQVNTLDKDIHSSEVV